MTRRCLVPSELREVLARTGKRVKDLRFSVTVPGPGNAEHWDETELMRTLRQWPNATIYLDPEGAAAQADGAQGSGLVVAGDAVGNLIFAGGVTGSRVAAAIADGNSGRRKLLKALRTGKSVASTPVSGCGLRS